MPSEIPRFIHFAWLDRALYALQLENIHAWAMMNPSYGVTLWCRTSNQAGFATHLNDYLEIHPQYSEVRSRRAYNQIIVEAFKPRMRDEATGGGDSFWDKNELAFDIHLRGVEVLQPVAGVHALYEEVHSWPGMPSREDLAGINAVYDFGGIFVDMTTKPPKVPLPKSILAPQDVLLCETNTDPKELIPAVVAAPQRCPMIAALANACAVHRIVGRETPEASRQQAPIDPFMALQYGSFAPEQFAKVSYEDFEKSFHVPENTLRPVPQPEQKPPSMIDRFRKSLGLAPKTQPQQTAPSSEFFLTPDRPEEPVKSVKTRFDVAESLAWFKYTLRFLTRRWLKDVTGSLGDVVDVRDFSFEEQAKVQPEVKYNDPRYNDEGYTASMSFWSDHRGQDH